MQKNDNILQAPATGFGQHVTFTTRPGDMPNIGAAGEGQSRSGVQGSPGAGSGVHAITVEAPPPNPTIALLQKIGGQFFASKLKEEKAAAFVTGMQRAAAGEALKDIAEGQPWYTRIFGESDVVEGARTYTAQARAAEAAGAIEDSMHEVRKLAPEEANAYFAQLVAKHMTGDDIADAALMQGFARTLPATMRRQAKEHYAWRQEEASTAESRALLSAADLLQKRAAAGVQTDDEYAQQAVSLIANMRPAQGRDVASWTKARTRDLVELAQAGKFHAVNAIRAAGMLDLLHPEQRTTVEKALDTAENRTIAAKSFEYAPELGRIAGQADVYSTDLSPEATTAALRALNDRFRKETGIDRDLISLDKGERILKDVHTTILREGARRIQQAEVDAKKAATEQDKALAKLTLETGAMQAIAFGQAGAAQRAEHMHKVVDEQFLQGYRQWDLPTRTQMLWLNYTGMGTGDGYVNKDIKALYERRTEVAIGAQMPADFLQLHGEYMALRDKSPALADAYFGRMADRMAVFSSLLMDGEVGSRGEGPAFIHAFGSQELPRAKSLGDKELKAAGGALASQHDSPDWQFWKAQRTPLRADQIAYATHDMAHIIAKYRDLPNTSMEQAVQRAFAEAQRDRAADMVGGFYIRGAAGQQPLTNVLRTHRPGDSAVGTGDDAPDVWDKALAGKVKQLAESVGANVSDPITIQREPDKDGVAWLTLYLTGKDGRPLGVRLSSNDIKDFATQGRQAQAAARKAVQASTSRDNPDYAAALWPVEQ